MSNPKHLYSLPKEDGFTGKRINVKKELLQFSSGKSFPYEIATVKNAVGILPVLPNGSLVLLENYRPPVRERLLEVPAGLIDDVDRIRSAGNFNFECEAAKRELKEETGYTAEEWINIGSYFVSPGWTTERLTLFIAKRLTPGVQELEETEQDIKVVEVPLDKAMAMIQNGVIKDMKTALLIQHYNSTLLGEAISGMVKEDIKNGRA